MEIRVKNILYIDSDRALNEKYDEEIENIDDYVSRVMDCICQDYNSDYIILDISE